MQLPPCETFVFNENILYSLEKISAAAKAQEPTQKSWQPLHQVEGELYSLTIMETGWKLEMGKKSKQCGH